MCNPFDQSPYRTFPFPPFPYPPFPSNLHSSPWGKHCFWFLVPQVRFLVPEPHISALLNCQIVGDFLDVFVLLISDLILSCSKRIYSVWFQWFKIYYIFPVHGISWWMFHVYLKNCVIQIDSVQKVNQVELIGNAVWLSYSLTVFLGVRWGSARRELLFSQFLRNFQPQSCTCLFSPSV